MRGTVVSRRLSEVELIELREKSQSEKFNENDRRRLVYDMAYHQCSWKEIATILAITGMQVEERYRDILNVAQSALKHDLRRMQVNCAFTNKGNPTMLIWLGKQYLEQSESPQMEMKKDQFDKFIEWISQQKTPSSLPAPSKSIAS